MYNACAYQTNNLRVTNRDALEHEITLITSRMTSAEFQDRLQAASIAFGAINSPDDLSAHPAFRSQVSKTADAQELVMPAHPVKRDSELPPLETKSPHLGEHTQRVLEEFSRS